MVMIIQWIPCFLVPCSSISSGMGLIHVVDSLFSRSLFIYLIWDGIDARCGFLLFPMFVLQEIWVMGTFDYCLLYVG
jgi:hypothetical protein